MHNHRGLDDFPPSVVDGWPRHIREQFRRRARAGAALRMYRRRGWNPSAVSFQLDRETETLRRLLDDLIFAEQNPTLF